MKNSIATYLFSGLIYLVALWSISPLLGRENQVDWFGTSIYQFLLLISWISFFLIFLFIGLVLNKSRWKTPWKKTLHVFKVSILGTIVIVGFGSIKYSVDFNRWQTKSMAERKEFEKTEELKFDSTVDSLQNIIDSGTSNSNVYFTLGLTYRHNGEWEHSIENYKKAIEVDSAESKYHSELAYSYSIIENYEDAFNHYEIAYSLDTTRKWIQGDIDRCRKMKEKKQVTQAKKH